MSVILKNAGVHCSRRTYLNSRSVLNAPRRLRDRTRIRFVLLAVIAVRKSPVYEKSSRASAAKCRTSVVTRRVSCVTASVVIPISVGADSSLPCAWSTRPFAPILADAAADARSSLDMSFSVNITQINSFYSSMRII